MILSRASKERIIENYLKDYNAYKIGIINCQKQLQYITPTLVTGYSIERQEFFVPNDTAVVAIERIEGKGTEKLRDEIKRFTLIVESIDRAVESLQDKHRRFVELRYFQALPMQKVMETLEYTEEKSVYRIRRKVLDKFLISLNNLIALK